MPSSRPAFANEFNIAGHVLLFSYVVAVVSSVLPVRLLDPAWQINLVTNLTDNAGIPLIGLLLIRLASLLNPGSDGLRRQFQALARLAPAAMIGFLLSVPLMLVANWRVADQLRRSQVARIETASTRLAELQSRIAGAATPQQVDEALRRFRGQGLPSPLQDKPLEAIRVNLLSQLSQARRQLKARRPGSSLILVGPLLPSVLRLGLTALAYALGFAALARRHGESLSLLDKQLLRYQQGRRARSWRDLL